MFARKGQAEKEKSGGAEHEEEIVREGGDDDDDEDVEDGGREVRMLRKTWKNEASETFYSAVRVGETGGGGGSETYSCGDCVMMETTSGV